MVLVDRIGLFGLDALDPEGCIYVPGARTGRQELEIIEERVEQQRGRGRTMKRGKKGMNNKEGKEERWKRWKEAMNN